MNRVTVKINGVEYNLKGKEDGKYLLDVAGYVDGKFREISANNSKLVTSSIAVLAALNIADELFKCGLEIEEIIKKKNSLEERHLTLKERLKELKEDIDQSAKDRINEVESLKKIIYSMEEKVSEVQKLQDTIAQLNEKVLEGEKYKSEVNELQKKLKLSEHENIKLKETVKTLEARLDKSVTEDEFKSVSMDLLKVQKENATLIAENENLKESVEEFSVKCKEAELIGFEYKETEEELRKIIMVKEAEIEDIKKMSLEVNEEKFEELKSQLLLMEQDLRNSINEKEALKARNKDISFKLHNYKYKILDLEKKLIDAQFDLAVEKKDKNPLLR